MAKDAAYFEKYKTSPEKDASYFQKYAKVQPDIKKQPWQDVLSDILTKTKEAPAEVFEGLKQFVPQTFEAAKTLGSDLGSGLEDIAVGPYQAIRAIGNVPSEFAEYLRKKGISLPGVDPNRPINPNFQPSPWEQSIAAREGEGHKTLQGLSSFGSAMAVPGGPLVKALMGGLWSGGQGENPFTGALMGVLPGGIKKGVEKLAEINPKSVIDFNGKITDKILNAVGKENLEEFGQNIAEKNKSPYSKFLPKTQLTPEQIIANMEAAKGFEVPLGRVFDDPKLVQKFENNIANIEGSPAYEVMNKTARKITDQGNLLLKNLESEATPEQRAHVGNALKDALIRETKNAEKTKRQKYLNFGNIASKNNITTDRSNFRKFARDSLEEIESDPDLSKKTKPEAIKALKDAAEESGKGVYSLNKTNILKGEFGQDAYDAKIKNETHLSNIYKGMNKALKKDIESSIDKSNNIELKNAYKDAESYFENEWLQFKDPNITKFTERGGDPDLLMQAFVKNSKLSDRGNLVKKITNHLKPSERDLMAHSYFSNAINENGIVDPMKLRTLYKNLGDTTREAMLGKNNPILDKYSRLVSMNTEALDLMRNPKTGSRGVPELVRLGTAGLGALMGHSPEAMAMQAVLGYGAPKAYSKLSSSAQTKWHTNENIRNKIAKELIKQQTKSSAQIPKHLKLFQEELNRARKENISDYNINK